MAQSILIVEDDAAIARLIADYLHLAGFATEIASTGPDGLNRVRTCDFACIVLDVMLPGMDGFEVCRRLREVSDVPVVMVTACTQDIDKIRGFGLGADDYVEKPFSPSVLVARIKAHIARCERIGSHQAKSVLEFGDLSLDCSTRRLLVASREVELKNREYELLRYFMLNPDVVLSRERIYEQVWGMDALGNSATVTVHINRLREKIEADPSHPRYLTTVWGAGYRFVP